MKCDGLLLIDKPVGWTSAKVVREVKKIFCGSKVGHAGTLDPLATGLLVLGIGESTKVLHYLIGQSKRYEACVCLGTQTTTGDSEGQVIKTSGHVPIDEAMIRSLLAQFVGELRQVPPMYSALKVEGKRLYKLARRQQTVERKPRLVTIHSLEFKSCSGDSFCLEVHCSKGTYIRVLAEDMGNSLNTVAHLASLRRTMSGRFSIDDAIDMQSLYLYRDDLQSILWRLLPLDRGLLDLPAVNLSMSQSDRMRKGGEIEVLDLYGNDFLSNNGLCRAYDASGSLVAVAAKDGKYLRPKRVFHK